MKNRIGIGVFVLGIAIACTYIGQGITTGEGLKHIGNCIIWASVIRGFLR
jgi:hypothetical protein